MVPYAQVSWERACERGYKLLPLTVAVSVTGSIGGMREEGGGRREEGGGRRREEGRREEGGGEEGGGEERGGRRIIVTTLLYHVMNLIRSCYNPYLGGGSSQLSRSKTLVSLSAQSILGRELNYDRYQTLVWWPARPCSLGICYHQTQGLGRLPVGVL